ncbi:MAG: type II toxin-antitoxin system VapC family toxin [Rhodospirillales bacterium]|nr:type II toxin-antitoxin system VapC family toxin [Rhodospirillales bacterium]
MIIDTSALLAIVMKEADAYRYVATMTGAERLRMSAVHWFEATMAVDSRGDETARALFDTTPSEIGFELIPFTEAPARPAREAWRRFGWTSRHPAKLNFGDCMAYGVARAEHEPLLFKGNDFPQTDIEPALKP